MGRLQYLGRDTIDPRYIPLFDRLERERPVPTGNLFRALAHAPNLLDAFLSYANAIRDSSVLNPQLRELAILVVGTTTSCDYEVLHHRRLALKAGLTKEQYEAVANFASSSEFDAQQKAVMHFAKELTMDAKVSSASWAAVKATMSDQEIIELILNIGWYNSAVRIMGAIDIDLE